MEDKTVLTKEEIQKELDDVSNFLIYLSLYKNNKTESFKRNK